MLCRNLFFGCGKIRLHLFFPVFLYLKGVFFFAGIVSQISSIFRGGRLGRGERYSSQTKAGRVAVEILVLPNKCTNMVLSFSWRVK